MPGIGKYKGEGEFNMNPSEFYGYGNQKKDSKSPLLQGNISDQGAESTCAAYGNPKPSQEERANMLKCPDFKQNKNESVKRGLGF